MDFYQYYLKRMDTHSDKKLTIQACRDLALGLIEKGPMAWGIESGVAFLTALYEINAPGVDLMPVYNEINEALLAKLQEMRLGMQADQQMAIQNTGCGRTWQRHKIK